MARRGGGGGKEETVKYVLTWWERPGGSYADYEAAQQRVLGVF